MAEFDVQGLLKKVFEELGAKPERLSIDVLLQKGGELIIYIIPGRGAPYITEEQARVDLRKGETLYRLNVFRLE